MPTSPVVRWGVRLVAGALVVALAALLGVRAYGKSRLAAAEREFAKRVGPQERSAPIGVKVAEEENASIFLRNGAEAMILPGDDRPLVGELAFEPVGRWSERNRADLRRILAANRAALELLRNAGGMTESDFGPLAWDEKTRELTTPPLLNLLTAQRLLLGDARIALVDREPRRVLSDAAAMATMATALEREAPGVELRMGLACEGMLLSLLEEAIAEPSTERATLVKLQAMLPDVDLRAAWRRSNLWEQGEIERHVTEVLSDPTGARQKPSLYGRLVGFAAGDIFKAQQLELRVDLVGAVDKPLGLDPPWVRRGMRRPRTFLDIFDVFESVMFGDTAKSLIGRIQSTLSLRNAAGTALRLRLLGFESGAYAETLALFPGAMQPDPFVGVPLAYERRPDGSARIAVPHFEKLWKKISDASPAAQPFSWELPAPPQPTRHSATRP